MKQTSNEGVELVSTPVVTTTTTDSMSSTTVPSDLVEYAPTPELDKMMNPISVQDVPTSIIDRWQTLDRIPWTGADALHSTIYDLTNPFTKLFHTTTAAAYVNAPLARYVSGFSRFRSDVEVRVTIQGNQNAYGTLVVASDPRKSTGLMPQYMVDPEKKFLSANDPVSTSYYLKWSEYTYMRPNDGGMNPIPRLRIFVMHPLSNASAAPVAATILIEARPRNMKVMMPTNNVTFQSAVALKEAKKVSAGDMLSAGAKSIGKVAIKTLKAASGLVHPLLPMALDLLPFDRPLDTSNLVRQVTVDSDIVSQVSGSTVSRRLGVAPFLPLPNIEPLDSDDYSKFSAYKKIWSPCSWFDVLPATAVDALIKDIPIHPCFTDHTMTNVGPPASVDYYFGALQNLAYSHGAWRGTLEYRAIIACPEGANFQMRVALEQSSATNFSSSDAGNAFNLLVDVRGNTVVDFSVPFQYALPYQTVPTKLSRAVLYQITPLRLVFTKVTNVVSPYATAVVPQVYVMVRGGDDFEVLLPQSAVNRSPDVEYQSAEVKPIFGADSASGDAVSYSDKIDNWNDFYKMAFVAASPDMRVVIPPHLANTFHSYRGAQRWVIRPTVAGFLRLNLPAITGGVRPGPFLAPLEPEKWHTFEVPYPSNQPNQPTWYNLGYGINTTSVASTSNIGATQFVSFCDDLQLFRPVRGPIMRVFDTAPS